MNFTQNLAQFVAQVSTCLLNCTPDRQRRGAHGLHRPLARLRLRHADLGVLRGVHGGRPHAGHRRREIHPLSRMI